jgi:DNA-directed RNA polymerase specialized sigma54-like protein
LEGVGALPAGVAVRSLPECLLIQLQQVLNPDPVSIEMLEEHFEALSPADVFVYKMRGEYTTPCGKGRLPLIQKPGSCIGLG